MTTAIHIPIVEVPADPRRRLGLLEVTGPTGKVALPLAGVAIRARVVDRIAEIDVEQRFKNGFAEALEATYVFPLGGAAAVSSFEMRVAGRTVKGKVEERDEARREYVEALAAGKRAALLEQERNDVFTLQVGNIPPGEEATIRISYAERLSCFEDGEVELRLPLVVAPRYVGGEPLEREPVGSGIALDTDRVPDASRLTPPRLAPGFDPNVALSVEVELFRDWPEATTEEPASPATGGARSAEQTIEGLSCSQHATRTSSGPESIRVSLARSDEPLDRDFVLRFRLARKGVRTALLVHQGSGESVAFLSLVPPAREGFLGAARDVVFVLDRSGSMEGVKMVSAARACGLLLRTLGPRDRFAIAAFSNAVEWMGGAPSFSVADEHGQEQGDRWLREIEANGGTELDSALGEALSALEIRKDAAGRAAIVVLVTDGQVADEAGVLRRLQRELGASRVFCVGIDTAVNTGLLTRLASLGGGTSSFVEPGAPLEEALRSISREIGEPLLVDLAIEDIDAGLVASSLAPQRLPDLFAGRAAFAAFRVGGPGRVRVKAKWSDGRPFEEIVEGRPTPLVAVAQIWARARVADLEDRFRLGEDEAKKEIVALGLRYSLLTRFTAFVAVDGEIVNRSGVRRQVTQPVAMPAGWAQPGMVAARTLTRSITLGGPLSPGKASGTLRALGRAVPGMTAMGALSPNFSEMTRGISEPGPAVYEESAAYEGGGGEEDLESALALLVAAMSDARTELAAARLPQVEPLERARAAVLAALASSTAGQRMPALQRFLRAGMVELIAALRSKTPLREVFALFESRAKELEEAKREARSAMPVASRAAFWEATI